MANEKRLIDANELWHKTFSCDEVAEVRKFIEQAPTVDAVEVVHGRWENRGGQRKMDLWCSVCNRRASNFVGGYEDWWDLWMPRYCPNCGAKMDGGNEDG